MNGLFVGTMLRTCFKHGFGIHFLVLFDAYPKMGGIPYCVLCNPYDQYNPVRNLAGLNLFGPRLTG